jgi:hypothetical protein
MVGQYADDLICGFQCQWCGVCFEDEHGWPVVCDSCGEDQTDAELDKLALQRATLKEAGA